MLPKRLRLRSREDFEHLFRKGGALFDPEIAIFFKKSTLAETRVGFAFKQKVFSKASERHFWKRKGSAVIRELYASLPQGWDMVFLFHKKQVDRSYKGLVQAMKSLVEKFRKESQNK